MRLPLFISMLIIEKVGLSATEPIWFRFDLIRFVKDFSVRVRDLIWRLHITAITVWLRVRDGHVTEQVPQSGTCRKKNRKKTPIVFFFLRLCCIFLCCDTIMLCFFSDGLEETLILLFALDQMSASD